MSSWIGLTILKLIILDMNLAWKEILNTKYLKWEEFLEEEMAVLFIKEGHKTGVKLGVVHEI